MSNHKASEGSVYAGANQVAELNGWTLEQSGELMEDTNLSDAAKTFKPGNTSWNGSIDCFWDETDTSGQGAFTINAELTLNLYPEGNTTGDTSFSGAVIITGISRSASINGMVEASYTFQGTGALTEATV